MGKTKYSPRIGLLGIRESIRRRARKNFEPPEAVPEKISNSLSMTPGQMRTYITNFFVDTHAWRMKNANTIELVQLVKTHLNTVEEEVIATYTKKGNTKKFVKSPKNQLFS